MKIREYRKEDATLLAKHLNESGAQWPELGIKQGVAYDEERIRAWFDSVNIHLFLMWINQEIAGLVSYMVKDQGNLHAYIPLVNVHPAYQRQGVANKLMEKLLVEIINQGLHRVDLHTWSANQKALPLYEKWGFIAVDKGAVCSKPASVFMLNYLPLVLSSPLIKKLLNFSRELKLPLVSKKPSQQSWHDLTVYQYDLKWPENFLSVKIDAQNGTITELKTKDLYYGFYWTQPQVLQGTATKFCIKVDNLAKQPLRINYHGLEKMPSAKILTTETSYSKEESFLPDQTLFNQNSIIDSLQGQIEYKGQHMKFIKDLKIEAPLQIQFLDCPLEMIVGEQKYARVLFENMLPNRGECNFDLITQGGLTITQPCEKITLQGLEKKEVLITLSAEKIGNANLECAAKLKTQDSITMLSSNRELLIRGQADIEASKVNNICLIANQKYRLQAEEASFTLFNREKNKPILSIKIPLLGSPFSQLSSIDQKLTVAPQGTKLYFSFVNPNHKNIIFEGWLHLKQRQIECTYRLNNLSNLAATVDILPTADVLLTPIKDVIFQSKGPILTEKYDAINFPGKSDFSFYPSSPKDVFQIFSSGDEKVGILQKNQEGWVEINNNKLLSQEIKTIIPPFTKREIAGPTYFFGSTVQEDIFKIQGISESDVKVYLEPTWDKIPQLNQGKGSGIIKGFNRGRRQRNLELDFYSPSQLTGTSTTKKLVLTNKLDYQFEVSFEENSQLMPGLYPFEIEYDFCGLLRQKTLPVMVFDQNKKISITQEKKCWKVENNLLSFQGTMEYGPTLTNINYNGEKLLATPDDKEGQWGWVAPFFGGITPVLFTDQNEKYPGLLHREKFNLSQEKIELSSNLSWEGISLSAEPSYLKGLQLKISYLTLSGLPLIAVVIKVKNSLNYTQSLFPQLYCFLAKTLISSDHRVYLKSEFSTEQAILRGYQFCRDDLDVFAVAGPLSMSIYALKQKLNFCEGREYSWLKSYSPPSLKLNADTSKTLISFLIPNQVNLKKESYQEFLHHYPLGDN